MTDLETFVKSKLNESIDAELGPGRPAPRFEPVATPPATRRTWLRPVLAAASVLVVVGAAVAISRASTNHHTQPPATTITNSDSWPLGYATFHGAKIAMPLGFTAHHQRGKGVPATLCLSPSENASACAIQVRYAAPNSQAMLDVDEPGGFYGDAAQVCAPQVTPPRRLTGTMTRDFGGRQAQWRVWETHCPGKTIVDEQYVAPSSPGFVLYTHNPSAKVRAGIDIVAQHSQLPTQNAPLWLTDRGRIRSVSSTVRDGKAIMHVVLARLRADGSVGKPPMLIGYDVPLAVYQQAESPQAGATVYLATNGHTVRLVEKR